MLFENLSLFLLIVEKGGLSAAGREAGLSPTSVSERLGALEKHYGATLLSRTTRSISLTDEGRVLVEGARRLLADAESIKSTIKLGSEQISGLVRLSAPVDLGRNRLVPILDQFLEANPNISIDLNLTDGFLDLTGLGIDIAIRYGALPDSTLKVRKLSEGRRVVCASPSYLSAHEIPEHPSELVHQQCILMRFGNSIHREWQFHSQGRTFKVLVSGRRIANDGDQVRQWCLAGHGICIKSYIDVREDLEAGRLVELLGDYSLPGVDLQMVYPSGHATPHRVKILMNEISSKLAI